MFDSSLYNNIITGFIVSAFLFIAARWLRSRSGHATPFEIVQFCVLAPIGLLAVASQVCLIVLTLNDSVALGDLLATAQIPLLVAVVALVVLNMSRLIWVFAQRERVPIR